jgi:hypothetical protein
MVDMKYWQPPTAEEQALRPPDMTPWDMLPMLAGGVGMVAPKAGGRMGKLLTRILQPKEIPTATKPQGLYYAIGKTSPHTDLGNKAYRAVDTARNVLDVDMVKVPHARFGSFGEGHASAGVAALKKLKPKEFERLSKMSKKELQAELKKKYPELKRLEDYYDSYELLEVYGAKEARKAGYDAIQQIDKQFPEFSEFVALTEGASRGAIR